MVDVQTPNLQNVLKEKMAQRRQQLNVTTDTLNESNTFDETFKSKAGNNLMSSMLQRRQQRQVMLDQSMGQSVGKSETSIDDTLKSGPVNLSTSIRERLKDRVKKTQETQDEPIRKLKGLRQQERQTRFDVESEVSETKVEGDDHSVSQDIMPDDILSASMRWKLMSKKGKLSQEDSTDVDEYSFFTKVYEDADYTPSSPPGETVMSEEETNFAFYDTVYALGKPELPKHDPSDKLFFPSKAEAEIVTLHGGDPCYLEEEGIFIGERPSVSSNNWNRMENRLLQTEGGKKWFGINGEMIVTPDPLKQISSRPCINFEVDESLQVYARCTTKNNYGQFLSDGSVHQLSVHVAHISFLHHHLFTKEHVLASHLKELYAQYIERRKEDLTKHMEDRLKSLREAVVGIRSTLGPSPWDSTKPFISDCLHNLKDYQNEIRNIRELCNIEGMKDKTLLKGILTVWKDIKAIRATQEFVSTNVQVLVYKEEVDAKKENKMWQVNIKSAFEERKEELMDVYETDLDNYRTNLKEWKVKSKENRRRQKLNKDSTEQLEIDVLTAKPAPPTKPNLKLLLTEIQETAVKCRKVPGESIVTVELVNTVSATPLEECPPEEQKRRKDIQKASYYGKFLYNNSEVTKTSVIAMTSEFTVNFNETYCVQVVHWPENITFELWDNSANEKVASIYLAIPPNDRHTGNAELEGIDFSSNQKVSTPNSTAVGSGIPTVAVEGAEQSAILLTQGKLIGSSAWVLDEEGKVLAPNRKDISANFGRVDPIYSIGANSLNDMNKVMQWVNESKLDPNDPRNAPLLHLILSSNTEPLSQVKYFRLDHLEKHTYFSTTEEIENNQRFKLLSLRHDGILEYKSIKMIPMHPSEITHFEHENIGVQKEGKIAFKEDGDIFDGPRAAFTKYLKDIQDKIATRSRRVKVVHELSDVVVEDQVPDISTLGRNIAKILEPRHPLRPQRKERKKVTNQAVGISSVDMLVHISQASDLPIRKRVTNESRMFSDSNIGGTPSLITLRPFVEISFQREHRSTFVTDGPNPHWNQELIVPLKVLNNEFSANNLRQISDIVYFNVFDEIIVDILEDDRLRDTNIHQRLERRWLGSFQIPFSTIYSNSRVEGKFKLNVPSVLLGYKKEQSYSQHIDPSSAMSISQNTDKDSYLSIFITVEPPLAPQPSLNEIFDTNEEVRLIRLSAVWEAELNQKFPTRKKKNLMTDVNGKSVFITRYITPQNPPLPIIPEDKAARLTLPAMQHVAKFVSLIPHYEDSTLFSGKCDIWITSELFLKMLAGDEEEHAILLCNYFLYMGITAYVVVGCGVPEGDTCYVLTKTSGNFILWNPSTGDHFPQARPYHPLKTVSHVFNNENIWANIQPYEDPERIRFDNFRDPKSWKPFFSSKNTPSLSTVQVSALEYMETDLEKVSILQDHLEKMLMDKIMEWRDRHVTRWNRYCIVAMRNLLPKLESGLMTEEDQHAALLDIMSSHSLTGFPINMKYSDVNTIVETVYSTNVHISENARVEFALAVYIHPYPNNVLSVWVYVGTLIKKGII